MKRFVKRGRTKLPLGRGVSTAGGNVDTAFKVALHDVFQCGRALRPICPRHPAHRIRRLRHRPREGLCCTGSTSHRAQYARAARPPLQGHRHRQSVGAFGFRKPAHTELPPISRVKKWEAVQNNRGVTKLLNKTEYFAYLARQQLSSRINNTSGSHKRNC